MLVFAPQPASTKRKEDEEEKPYMIARENREKGRACLASTVI
jgi:hypothetical protein